MKPLLCVLCVLCGSLLSAADLTLTDGRVLKDASIVSQSADKVTVKHAAGLASVAKATLPTELRAKYPVTVPTVTAAPSELKPADSVARARAAEQSRIAKAKAAREARAQWLLENPQDHEIIYRVQSRTPGTKATFATPEGGLKTITIQTDGWGVWEQKFTAKDGFALQLSIEELSGSYAEAATVSIVVDGAEVRKERLEPKSGGMSVAWNLGALGSDQPQVARSSGNGAGSEVTSTRGITNVKGTGRMISETHTAGWVGTRE